MCFSKRESLLALILGTVINIAVACLLATHPRYRTTRRTRLAVVAAWQFALLMQIPEAVQWHYMDRSQAVPSYVNPLAYWLNNLQPIVMYLAVAAASVGHVSSVLLMLGSACAVAFTAAAAVHFRAAMADQRDLQPAADCRHLNLHWWQHRLRPYLGFYMLGVIAALALVPDHQRWVQLAVFIGSFILAANVYHCGGGSVWCWSIAPASLTLLI